jgi:hypothetical protein
MMDRIMAIPLKSQIEHSGQNQRQSVSIPARPVNAGHSRGTPDNSCLISVFQVFHYTLAASLKMLNL